MLATRAPAKINLTLHVLGRRPDGYHDLDSIVVFAGVADLLTLRPGPELSLTVDGPTAGTAGPTADNLVVKAAEALAARHPGLTLGTFRLTKRLPAMAGIGGGSSDAAAALRLLGQANGWPTNHPDIVAAAAATGSDVPVCLEPTGRTMRGAGEQVGPALRLPPLFGVLVNPGVAVPTPAVFRALGLQPGEAFRGGERSTLDPSALPAEILGGVRDGRNDLEPPARALAPAIGSALDALRVAPGCALARMSGSGATVFGLFDHCRSAAAAAKLIRAAEPGWWIRATVFR